MLKIGFVANEAIAEQCEKHSFCQKVFCVNKFTDAVHAATSFQCDFLVMELLAPGLDGFMLIEAINQMPNPPKIVVVTELTSEILIVKAYKMGVYNYLIKPVDANQMLQALTSVSNNIAVRRSIMCRHNIEEYMNKIFASVGISANIKGFQYLKEGVTKVMRNPTMINSLTKKLYPAIGEKFDTTGSKVERAIRHAIEVACNRGKMVNLNEILGVKVFTASCKPTNGELIALVANKMIAEFSNQ